MSKRSWIPSSRRRPRRLWSAFERIAVRYAGRSRRARVTLARIRSRPAIQASWSLGRGRPACSSSSRCASARHARRSPWPRSISCQVGVRYSVSRRACRGSPCASSSLAETSHRMSISTPPKSKMTPRIADADVSGGVGGGLHEAYASPPCEQGQARLPRVACRGGSATRARGPRRVATVATTAIPPAAPLPRASRPLRPARGAGIMTAARRCRASRRRSCTRP